MNEDDILLNLFKNEERRSATSGRRAAKRGTGVGIPSHYLNCLSSPSYYQYLPSTKAPAGARGYRGYGGENDATPPSRRGRVDDPLSGPASASAPTAADVHGMFRSAGLDMYTRTRTPGAVPRAASASSHRDKAASTPPTATRSASADTPGSGGRAASVYSSSPAARPQEPTRSPFSTSRRSDAAPTSPSPSRAGAAAAYSSEYTDHLHRRTPESSVGAPSVNTTAGFAGASPCTTAHSVAEEIDRSDSAEGRAKQAIQATIGDLASLGPSDKFKRSVERLLAAVSSPLQVRRSPGGSDTTQPASATAHLHHEDPLTAAVLGGAGAADAADTSGIDAVERQLEFPAETMARESEGPHPTTLKVPPFARAHDVHVDPLGMPSPVRGEADAAEDSSIPEEIGGDGSTVAGSPEAADGAGSHSALAGGRHTPGSTAVDPNANAGAGIGGTSANTGALPPNSFLDLDGDLLARDVGVFGLSEFDADAAAHTPLQAPHGHPLDTTATTDNETPLSAEVVGRPPAGAAGAPPAPAVTPLRSIGSSRSDESKVTTPLSSFMQKQGQGQGLRRGDPEAGTAARGSRALKTPSTVFSKPPGSVLRDLQSPTPHRNIPSVQAELVRLVYNSILDRDEEVRDLQMQLARKFTLVEDGVGVDTDAPGPEGAACRISKIPTKRTADGVEIDEADDPDLFRGDAAISSLVNISDGLLCRLISQQSAREGTQQLLSLAASFTHQLLRELESELRYNNPDPAGATPDRSVSRRREERAVPAVPSESIDYLRACAAAHPSLRPALDAFAAAAEAMAKQPHAHRVLSDIVAATEACLKACDPSSEGASPAAPAADAPRACDADLVATLRALKQQEDAEKEQGRLEASAKLRNQQLHEQAKWLKENLGKLGGAASRCDDVLGSVRKHTGTLDRCIAERERLAGEAVRRVHDCTDAVAEQRRAYDARERQNAEDGAVASEELEANAAKAEAVMAQIEGLYKQLEGLQQERCGIVKRRIEGIGAAAIDSAAGATRVMTARRDLRDAEERAEFLTGMEGVAEGARAVRGGVEDLCGSWADDMRRQEAAAHEAVVSTAQRVWDDYQRSHQTWCGILERSVGAMEKRLVLLRRMVVDAEERYDEDDRDRTTAEIVRVTHKLEQLHADLQQHRDAFIETYQHAQQYISPRADVESPSPAPAAVVHVEASPFSHDDLSPGYTPSVAGEQQPLPSPMVQEAMAHIGLADALKCLGRDPAVTASWQGSLDRTDLRTMADLYRVRSVPTVWRSFLCEKPLLKSELSVLLQKHLTAATEATAHVHPPPVLSS